MIGNAFIGSALTLSVISKSMTRYFVAFNMLCSWGLYSMIVADFLPGSGMQFIYDLPGWSFIRNHQISFSIDGLSLVLIGLLLFIFSLIFIHLFTKSIRLQRSYWATLLFVMGIVMGLFSVQDTVAFYIFWEGMMFPMYFLIGIWGGENRYYAAMKFFIYTFATSLMMLMALLYIGVQAGGYSFSDLYQSNLSLAQQMVLFFPLMLAMAVKTPMWPVHTWLPDAHTEASTEGSVLLAGLLLKVGGYAMLRLLLPVLPLACAIYAPYMVVLSLIAIIYVGMLTSAQNDMKCLIAYSSIAHMGFVTLGLFSAFLFSDLDLINLVLLGSCFIMVAHGLSSGALFFSFGMIYERLKTRSITQMSGLSIDMPWLSALFCMCLFSVIGLPGTAGFVGEWMIFVGLMKGSQWLFGICAIFTMVVAAIYMLQLYRNAFLGPKLEVSGDLIDLSFNEKVVLLIPVGAILFLGLFPGTILNIMQGSIGELSNLILLGRG